MCSIVSIIQSKKDIERIVHEWGFLPFFSGEIEHFSLEEMTPPELWFPEEDLSDMGVWDYKTDIILEADCAYGKFYQKKACFVSMDWFPDLVNVRRAVCKLTKDEQKILSVLKEHHSLLSKELKRFCGYEKPRQAHASNPLEKVLIKEAKAVVKTKKSKRESFDTAITHLQMAGMVVSAAFEYNYDKQGKRYGWGVARYCTPEDFFGEERLIVPRSPEESFQRIATHLQELLPHANQRQIERVIAF